jgi:hypothetical protein
VPDLKVAAIYRAINRFVDNTNAVDYVLYHLESVRDYLNDTIAGMKFNARYAKGGRRHVR